MRSKSDYHQFGEKITINRKLEIVECNNGLELPVWWKRDWHAKLTLQHLNQYESKMNE